MCCLISLCLVCVHLTFFKPLLQGLCLCLDFQFDTVVKDRPTILSKLLLLHFLKQDIPTLSWEFFVNRFETLSLEAQLHLDCNKEFPFPTSKQNKDLALKVSSYSCACWISWILCVLFHFPLWKLPWLHVLSSSNVYWISTVVVCRLTIFWHFNIKILIYLGTSENHLWLCVP